MIRGAVYSVVDNSGVKLAKCIGFRGPFIRKFFGKVIVLVVKKVDSHKRHKQGEVFIGLVVRNKERLSRPWGIGIRSLGRGVIVLKKDSPYAKRMYGPLFSEIRSSSYNKIVSLSSLII